MNVQLDGRQIKIKRNPFVYKMKLVLERSIDGQMTRNKKICETIQTYAIFFVLNYVSFHYYF